MHTQLQNLIRDTLSLIQEEEFFFCEKELLPHFSIQTKKTEVKTELKKVILPKKKPPPPEVKKTEPTTKHSFDDFAHMLKTSIPGITLRKENLDDTHAKKIATQWKHVPVLIFTDERDEVFEKLAKAITQHFLPAKVCHDWNLPLDSQVVKLILTTKKIPAENITQIQLKRAHYYQDPNNKRQLWQTISKLLKK